MKHESFHDAICFSSSLSSFRRIRTLPSKTPPDETAEREKWIGKGERKRGKKKEAHEFLVIHGLDSSIGRGLLSESDESETTRTTSSGLTATPVGILNLESELVAKRRLRERGQRTS